MDEAKALVEMAGPGVVFVDIEEEPVSVQILEDHTDDFGQDLAAQPLLRDADYDPLQLDSTIILVETAQYGVGLQLSGLGFTHKIARVPARKSGAMACLVPLADEGTCEGQTLQGKEAGDVVSNRGAKQHEIQINC